jgi:Ca2+-binding RTX toxin-like protein
MAISGTGKNDNIVGTGADDTILAGGGNDTVYAGAGDDTILGGTGNDTIDGGSGNDIIVGATDDDTLTGRSGSDSFVFNFAVRNAYDETGGTTPKIITSEGHDVITDFDYRNVGNVSPEGGTTGEGSDRLVFKGMSGSQYDLMVASGHISFDRGDFTGDGNVDMRVNFNDTHDSIVLSGIGATNIADLAALKDYIDFGIAG